MRAEDDDSGFDCPHCGSPVPAGARRCRHCGASDECGWNEDAAEWPDGGYAEEDDFDYDAWVEREFGTAGGNRAGRAAFGMHRMWLLAVLCVLTMLAVLLIR